MFRLFFVLYFIELSVGNSMRTSFLSYIQILQHNSIAQGLFTGQLVMAFSQNLLAGANRVPSCDVELCPRSPSRVARFYGETGHFKLNFCIENSHFSQYFVSGIHIYTFSHNFAGKNLFHRHFKY